MQLAIFPFVLDSPFYDKYWNLVGLEKFLVCFQFSLRTSAWLLWKLLWQHEGQLSLLSFYKGRDDIFANLRISWFLACICKLGPHLIIWCWETLCIAEVGCTKDKCLITCYICWPHTPASYLLLKHWISSLSFFR